MPRSAESAKLGRSLARWRLAWLAPLPFVGLANGLTVADVSAASAPEYSISDIYAAAQKWQVTLARVQPDDPACSAPLSLAETEQDGEHAVYGAVVLSGPSKLTLSAKASERYGIQFGFVSGDWKSYAFAYVSLVSGSYRVTESGSLRHKDVAVRSRAADWLEMELIVEQLGTRDAQAATSGYAIIKPATANGNTFYRGEAWRGVTLCTTKIKGP